MYLHINVNREKPIITKKLKESMIMFDNPDELIFFNVLDFLGCYISVFFKRSFSASDCCNTVESLEKIFQITKYDKDITISKSDELKSIFDLEGNFFLIFDILTKGLPYHTFVIVKYKNNWFLLQSFAGICGLSINEDINIPHLLLDFTKTPTTIAFNHLFKTSLNENKNINPDDLEFSLSYKEFDKLPLNRLYNLIETFIQ